MQLQILLVFLTLNQGFDVKFGFVFNFKDLGEQESALFGGLCSVGSSCRRLYLESTSCHVDDIKPFHCVAKRFAFILTNSVSLLGLAVLDLKLALHFIILLSEILLFLLFVLLK